MVDYMDPKEQVDKDFSRARRQAFLGQVRARLRNEPASERLPSFDQVRKKAGAVGRIDLGLKTVRVEEIVGSVGRRSGFDRGFMPAKSSVEERWKRIDRAFRRGEELPPVSLYKVGDVYFVLNGHHRVSVARYQGVEWIDAYVTEFRARLPQGWRQADGPSERGETGMHEMMNFEFWKQRREEMMREAEQNRLAGELQAARMKRAGARRATALLWELKRHAGRLHKLLRAPRKDGQEIEE